MTEEILAESIALRLRRDILRGKLVPGTSIKERDNATEMGVSRTPMREAIRILANEGLVQLRPSRSPIVTQLSLNEVVSFIEVLSALEMLAVTLACERATKIDIAHVRGAERKLATQYDRIDQVERFELDMDFHIALTRASHNQALSDTHMSYLRRLWYARFQSARNRHTKDRVLQQHAALVDAIERRDPTMAQTELSSHLENLRINVHAYFERAEREQLQLKNSA